MAWIALKDDGEPYSILTKYFSQEEFQSLLDAVDGKPGDFILFCADQFSTVCRTPVSYTHLDVYKRQA